MGKSNLKFIKTSALMEELERRERLESKITFYCVLPCFIAVINAVGIKISYVVQCYCNELCYKILMIIRCKILNIILKINKECCPGFVLEIRF